MPKQYITHPVLPDDKIVELYWSRDESAIAETDRKYRSYLHTIAYNILYDAQICEECLNDTYFKTWNNIPPTMPKVLRAFLAKILRNTAVDRYHEDRRNKRVPPELQDSLNDFEGVLSEKTSLDDAMEAKEIGRIISAYLDSVSDRKLYIFVSRFYFALPVAKIAQTLGLSESTVHKELALMKKALRNRLISGGIEI